MMYRVKSSNYHPKIHFTRVWLLATLKLNIVSIIKQGSLELAIPIIIIWSGPSLLLLDHDSKGSKAGAGSAPSIAILFKICTNIP